MRTLVVAVLLALVTLSSPAAMALEAQSSGPPQARKDAPTERRFGLSYSDPYRWMENADDSALYPWLSAEAAYTDARTAGTLRDALAVEFQKIFSGETGMAPDVEESVRFEERRLQMRRFRLIQTGEEPETGRKASPSGRYEIVSEPDNTDIHTLHIKDIASGMFLQDTLRVKNETVIWDEGESSFVYYSMRDGRLGGATVVVRRHTLGEAQLADKTLVESTDPTEEFDMTANGSKAWLRRESGSGNRLTSLDLATGEEETVLETPAGLFTIFKYGQDKIWAVSFLNQDMGEIVTLDLATRKLETAVPARDVALDRASFIGNDIYISYVRNGVNELTRFQPDTGALTPIPLPAPGMMGSMGLQKSTGRVLFYLHTYTARPDLYAYDPQTGRLTLLVPGPRPDVELEASCVQYEPHKGWTAPIWVVKRKDVQFSPDTPMYVYGYGGFRVNTLPYFDSSYLPWLRRGGAVAFVVLPGGLELGEAWHRLGMLKNKRNVFDACARATKTLIDKGWTSRDKTALGGASNGGLLAAATARYYPGIFRVTVPQVGVLDMGRFSLFTSGSSWIPEYGNRDDGGAFKYLMSISPYNHVKRGMPYPSTLVVTADLDDRVAPLHSYKFAARLQTARPEGDALLLVAHGTGHNFTGATTEENVRTASIMWTFIMNQTGMQ